ncbi:hypothetical protein LCGC14_2401790 [marine sediment metagenome]|uniref:Uncharacterized protein n=1 Tax=marine sediment metagenome TaxID=412755 RepID=A0A0F9CH98_9ZZZZ
MGTIRGAIRFAERVEFYHRYHNRDMKGNPIERRLEFLEDIIDNLVAANKKLADALQEVSSPLLAMEIE